MVNYCKHSIDCSSFHFTFSWKNTVSQITISRTELAFLIYNIPCFQVKLQAHMHINLYIFISFIRRFHSHHLTKWHKHQSRYKRNFMIELRVQDRFMLHSSAKIYTLDNIITELWYYEFDSVAIHFSDTFQPHNSTRKTIRSSYN